MYGGLIHPHLLKLKVISEFTAVRGAESDNNQQYRDHTHARQTRQVTMFTSLDAFT
jgi:hypothetical protein